MTRLHSVSWKPTNVHTFDRYVAARSRPALIQQNYVARSRPALIQQNYVVPCCVLEVTLERRSTIEVHHHISGAPDLRDFAPHPRSDFFCKNQTHPD